MIRSRLVAQYLNVNGKLRADLCSPTPPLECLKALVHIFVCSQAKSGGQAMMHTDISRAYVHATCQEDAYVKIPPEDFEEGDEYRCGKLNLWLYGMRGAAVGWEQFYVDFLEGRGFVRGMGFPNIFYNPQTEMILMVHGDDFFSTGSVSDIEDLMNHMVTRFKCKHTMVSEDSKVKSMKMLNRIITLEDGEVTYAPDDRHAKTVVESLGLQDSRHVATPRVTSSSLDEKKERGEPMSDTDSTSYRSVVATLNFLAQYRPDIQDATRECSKRMAKPHVGDLEALTRLGRYIKGKPHVAHVFWFGFYS